MIKDVNGEIVKKTTVEENSRRKKRSNLASVPQTCMPSPLIFSARRQTYSVSFSEDDSVSSLCKREAKVITR